MSLPAVLVLAVGVLYGCQAVESHESVAPAAVAASGRSYDGPRPLVTIGLLQNRSGYGQGVFSDGTDHVGMQARQILMAHLTQSNHFRLLDHVNLEDMAREAELGGRPLKIEGADYIITGSVTEFGRRQTGSRALAGVLGKTRKQTAYAKVSLTVVNARTSAAVCSVQGAGEYDLQVGEVLGFGSTAGYDATLTDKVLNLAILNAVDKLAEVFGADAVLYVDILDWRTTYVVVDSSTHVRLHYQLVDTRTATPLWEWEQEAVDSSSSGQSDLIGLLLAAALHKVINETTDLPIHLAAQANTAAVRNREDGMRLGPRHRRHREDQQRHIAELAKRQATAAQ